MTYSYIYLPVQNSLIMVSVQQAVRVIVEENPLYLIALSSGIANLSAIAREVKPLVESIVGKEVNLMTIVKALERLTSRKTPASIRDIGEALEKAEVVIFNGVDEVELSLADTVKLYESHELMELFKGYSILLTDGERVKLIAPVAVLGKFTNPVGRLEYTLVRIMFGEKAPVGFVTFMVQLARASGITIRHMLRYDNDVFIVVERSYAVALLKLIEDLRNSVKRRQVNQGNDTNK
ncbi:hypothetical protein Cmaq_0754 [Caldivirga maquilingensis IC-167]|uniref:ACT domain-containing protein n=2 Tax=Caldivirga maquilingensis TaxID=76887 RepID=A8MCT4_CALMQ|nr:hypothetical protein Cmaq_0754 [Caldivirga maquilingensis IC-167]